MGAINSLLTFEISHDGLQIDIHGDETGLRSLADKVLRVISSKGHDHLMTESWAGNELSEERQGEKSLLVNKVTIHYWTTDS